MHEVVVLTTGYVQSPRDGRQAAAATVTLFKGSPNIVVDTGDPLQRDEILASLASHGVSTGQVAWVVNTHGHLDHVGNNNLFPDATFVLEADLAQRGEYWTHDFAAGPLLINAGHGDSPVRVVLTPGHTDHDLSVLVRTAQGIVAAVGDLFEYADDVIDGAWKVWSRDVERQRASREEMLASADFIIPGHGPMFRTRAG